MNYKRSRFLCKNRFLEAVWNHFGDIDVILRDDGLILSTILVIKKIDMETW
ncbi:15712_t:CDS:2 [Entrophospora sp. SA101]|nr:11491_t:CDS:2 [Entrophospora sp. SA101]CAJ0901321.1 15712_t:CDS:2 [Entrophospora sp. SA101]